MTVHHLGACAVLAATLCGCVKEVPAPPDAVAAFSGKQLTIITHTKPSFSIMTWGSAALIGVTGVAGAVASGAAMTSEGDHIIQDNKVDDPAVAAANKIGQELSAKLLPSTVVSQADVDVFDSAEIAKKIGGNGLVLDTQTLLWTVLYFPFDWTHYKIIYQGRARLIDAATGKQIALALCKANTADEKNPPSYDQLLADHAAVLKAKLNAIGETCQTAYNKTLGLP